MSVESEIAPNGDMRVVFAGPLRLVKFNLTRPSRLDPEAVLELARELQRQGRLRIRHPKEDSSAQSVFDLAGTKSSVFPLGLIGAFELPLDTIANDIKASAAPFVGSHSPFKSHEVTAAVLRLFASGYAAVIVTIDFRVDPGAASQDTTAFLSKYFALDSERTIELRQASLAALNRIVPTLCADLTPPSTHRGAVIEAQVRFLSTFYTIAASWDVDREALHFPKRLRGMLQPEAEGALRNQSNSFKEIVCFTSGFHAYIWNRRETADPLQRQIALVSFLNLMNILYVEIDDIKEDVARRLKDGRTPLVAPTDLDEKLEILFGQVMVSSASWRRDFSSFRDEINHRWRLGEAKDFCLTLIQALEARSSRKRALVLGLLIGLFTFTQIVSVIEDGYELYERFVPGAASTADDHPD